MVLESRIKKNKRGSQVEFVVSFILFVTFIIFVYVLLSSKIDSGQSKRNSLDNAEAGILNMITDNLTVSSVSVNSGGNSGSCFTFTGLASTLSLGNNLIAQDSSGAIVPAYSKNKDITIVSPSTFFTIYYSPNFLQSSGNPTCTNLGKGEYIIGLSKNQSAIFETKITKAFAEYSVNYTIMKKSIGIFPGDEFGMKFTYQNGSIIKTPETNSTVSIFADSIPVQYVTQDLGIQFGHLEVEVW